MTISDPLFGCSTPIFTACASLQGESDVDWGDDAQDASMDAGKIGPFRTLQLVVGTCTC